MSTVAPLRDATDTTPEQRQARADRLAILHMLKLPGTLPPSGTLGGGPCNDIQIPVFGEWDESNARWVSIDRDAAKRAMVSARLDFQERLKMHTKGSMELSPEGRDKWWPISQWEQ